MWEYAIIPVSFKNYDEYVNVLNDYGSEGWIFGAMIRVYENSPTDEYTTHDFICRRAKKLLFMMCCYKLLKNYYHELFRVC